MAIFLPSLSGGGAERVFADLANALCRQGYEIDLVLAQRTGPYLADLDPEVRVCDLGASGVVGSLRPLARYIRDTDAGVLISALNHANVIALSAKALSGSQIRMVVSERNSPKAELQSNLTSRAIRLLMRALYRRADAVVAVSEGIADQLVEHYGVKRAQIAVINNPVDTERIDRLAGASIEHPWLPSPDGSKTVLAVGRLEPQKDYKTLLRAVSLSELGDGLRLVVLGEGSQRSALERLAAELNISDQVDFAGWEPNPFAYMAKASLYVLSSKWEGFPNSLIQAMGCGVPVVSTDCETGPSEILAGGRWGRLVPVGDAQALASAIDATLIDGTGPDVRRRAGDFHPEVILAQYLAVLRGE
ncbi:glycosyltransferase [Blastococcus sp. TF02-09]|nr:glycosyltransferase [Blastococcus sp. TF02-9]